MSRTSGRRSTTLIDRRSGGFVIAGAAVIFLLAALRWTLPALSSRGPRALGDGKNIDTYGFDLSTLQVSRDVVVPGGIPRDGIPALTLPRIMSAREAATAPAGEHGRFLVSGDLVIGITRNGAARAYPLRILNWHEVANDTLGGEPVAVTFNPPSFGIAAFDRRIGGHEVTFGVSGLLYQSNLLMYDRGAPTPSLWSQFLARAVSGPAATGEGSRLELLPVVLSSWSGWVAKHPETTVAAGEERRTQDYQRDPYSSYFSSEEVRFRTAPLPPGHEPVWKSVVRIEGDPVAPSPGNGSPLETILPEIRVIREDPDKALEAATTPEVPARYAFLFSWYAITRTDSLMNRPPGA